MKERACIGIDKFSQAPRRGARVSFVGSFRPWALFIALVLFCAALEGLSGCGFTSAASSGTPPGTLSFNPASLSFGNIAIGADSAQTLALANTGNGSLTISQANLTDSSFSVPDLQLPLAISAGNSAVVHVHCKPHSSGSVNGTLTLSSNASDPSLSMSLSCVGVQGQLATTPSSVNFGSVNVGSTASQTITLTNSGTASVNLTQDTVSGAGYTLSGPTLPATLAPGQNASYSVTFAPTAPGNAAGNISVVSDAANSPLSIPLSGTGTQAALAVAPTSLSFGNIAVGGKATETLTLTDTGNAVLVITAANLSGSGYSLIGVSLPWTIGPGQSGTLSVQFAPPAAGSANGSVSLVSNAPGSPLSIPLSGSGVAQTAVLTVSPTSVNFGNLLTGSTSSETLSLSNTGTASLTVSQIATTGAGFSAAGLTPPVTLAGGQTASVTVTFAPTAAGSASGTVTITSTASNPTVTVTLAGTATAPQPQITLSPTSINFGNVNVGQSSSQNITVSNPGNATLNITQATVTGTTFRLTGVTFPLAISPGQSAVWTASFSPTSATSFTGSISITSNAAGSPTTLALSGTGVDGLLTVSPTSLSFGNVLVGSSGSQTVTLTNSGTASLTVTQASESGGGYSLSGLNLPLTLGAGQNASFSVSFAPTVAGSATGSVSLTSNASNPNLTIGLSGTGIQPQLSASPTSVSFGSITVGNTNSQSIVLNNSGTAALTISQATVSGPGFGMSGLTVPLTIAAGANATFTATYTPTTAGSASGSISLTSNAPGSPTTLALSGTGVDGLLTASPTSISFGNVLTGSTSSQTLTLSNTGTASLTVSQIATTGAGFSAAGLTPPVTLAGGQTASVTVTFAPTVAGSATGSVSLTSNASNPNLTIGLSGTGIQPQLSASPTSVSFGSITVGNTNSQSIVLNNSGTAALTISQATVSGPGFGMSGLTVPLTIAAGANATFTATYTPTTAGSASGSISLTSNAPGSPLTISLAGTGVARTYLLNASPTSLSFGNVIDGGSYSLNVILTNGGNSNVTISQVSASDPSYTTSGIATGTTLAPGQSATLTVSFSPTIAGTISGSVTVTSNATNSPLTIALSGTGVQQHSVALSWNASTSSVVGYFIYRGSVSGGPYTKLNSTPNTTTSYTDTTVVSGQTFYYVVTSVDSNNVESAYSNEVAATIP